MPDSRQSWFDHPHALPRTLRDWLCDKGSLTGRLKARCPRFRVVPLTSGLARPNRDEYALLRLRPGEHAYVREVLLLCDDVPVVFAHSVLPYPSLRGEWNGISRLGSRPLGEALFNDHRIRRLSLAYRNIHPDHPLFRALAPHHPVHRRKLWARRSTFCLAAQPLLVTEVFLPEIDSL
ncbi:MAG: chorismate lyase [Thiobacillus sp.]|nr:chorismate lyase [Thiobacillus sp.]